MNFEVFLLNAQRHHIALGASHSSLDGMKFSVRPHDGCLAELHGCGPTGEGRVRQVVRTYRGYSSLPLPTLPTSPFSSIRDRRKQWRVNLGSGNTGSTSSVSDAHFRKTTMMASVHTVEGIGRCIGDCPTAPEFTTHICSARCCSNDSSCYSRSRKESAKVARLPWARWVVPGLLAHEVVG